jgi:Ni/Co efflux regulator RcnB
MKRLLLTVGIAVGLNTSIALAQHEKMPGHENMPPGDHVKHKKNDGNADKKQPRKTINKKKSANADKKQPPKSNGK